MGGEEGPESQQRFGRLWNMSSSETVLAEDCALCDMIQSLSHASFPECNQSHELVSMIRFLTEK